MIGNISISSVVLTWSLQARCQGLVKLAVQLVVGSISTVTTWSVHKQSMGQLEVVMLLGCSAVPSRSAEYYQSLIGVVNHPPFIRSLDLLEVSAWPRPALHVTCPEIAKKKLSSVKHFFVLESDIQINK